MGDMDELASKILENQKYRELFNADELTEIQKQSTVEEIDVPSLLLNDDWGVSLAPYARKFQSLIHVRSAISNFKNLVSDSANLKTLRYQFLSKFEYFTNFHPPK